VFESLGRNGVEITAEVDYLSESGNNEPWLCPRCGLELDVDDLIAATCSSCGYSANLGDWPVEFPSFSSALPP